MDSNKTSSNEDSRLSGIGGSSVDNYPECFFKYYYFADKEFRPFRDAIVEKLAGVDMLQEIGALISGRYSKIVFSKKHIGATAFLIHIANEIKKLNTYNRLGIKNCVIINMLDDEYYNMLAGLVRDDSQNIELFLKKIAKIQWEKDLLTEISKVTSDFDGQFSVRIDRDKISADDGVIDRTKVLATVAINGDDSKRHLKIVPTIILIDNLDQAFAKLIRKNYLWKEVQDLREFFIKTVVEINEDKSNNIVCVAPLRKRYTKVKMCELFGSEEECKKLETLKSDSEEREELLSKIMKEHSISLRPEWSKCKEAMESLFFDEMVQNNENTNKACSDACQKSNDNCAFKASNISVIRYKFEELVKLSRGNPYYIVHTFYELGRKLSKESFDVNTDLDGEIKKIYKELWGEGGEFYDDFLDTYELYFKLDMHKCKKNFLSKHRVKIMLSDEEWKKFLNVPSIIKYELDQLKGIVSSVIQKMIDQVTTSADEHTSIELDKIIKEVLKLCGIATRPVAAYEFYTGAKNRNGVIKNILLDNYIIKYIDENKIDDKYKEVGYYLAPFIEYIYSKNDLKLFS